MIRRILLEEFRKDPSLDCRDIAKKYGFPVVYTKRVIGGYRKLFDVSFELWVVKSLSDNNTYYLFNSFGEEKKIMIKDNKVKNNKHLTEYEKLWLKINLKFY